MARKKGIARKANGKIAWGAGRHARKARKGEKATEKLAKKSTSIGAGRLKRAAKQGAKATKKLSGTTWAKGKSPAQGSTPKKMSKPELGTGKFKGAMSKGKKTAARKGKSPTDGRGKK